MTTTPAPEPAVTVIVTPRMARLLARLQQLAPEGRRVVVDLDAWTAEVCGRVEHLDRDASILRRQ